MSNCSHQCGSCSQSCNARRQPAANPHTPANARSSIQKVIGIVSGKGGVGKSTTCALLSAFMQRRGFQAAVLDADLTGPCIPRLFGIHERARANESGLYPAQSKQGVRIMSMNLLLEQETDPVVWRGPVIAGVIKQFWQDVLWGNIDFMFIDMPPGTGDVPLTVFQSLPVDGIIIVTTPQEMVSMVVEKAINMASMMHIPVIGIIENFSWTLCPDCGKKIHVFGESHLQKLTARCRLPLLAQCPIDPALLQLADSGQIEQADSTALAAAADHIQAML